MGYCQFNLTVKSNPLCAETNRLWKNTRKSCCWYDFIIVGALWW